MNGGTVTGNLKAAYQAVSATSKLASAALPAVANAANFAGKQVSKVNTTTIPGWLKPSPSPTSPSPTSPSPTAPSPTSPSPTSPTAPTSPSPTSPTSPTGANPTVTITDPKELNLFQQFLQKVKSGDLKDVVNPEPDELSVFAQIKQKMKEGDFSDIVKSLPSPPPFPTAAVMQVVGALNDIFQQNVGKISTFATAAIDTELAKQQNKLKLNNDMAARATGEALDKHMNIYVTQALT